MACSTCKKKTVTRNGKKITTKSHPVTGKQWVKRPVKNGTSGKNNTKT